MFLVSIALIGAAFIIAVRVLNQAGGAKFTIIILTSIAIICLLVFYKCKETDNWQDTLGRISVNTPNELGANFIVKKTEYYTFYPNSLVLYADKMGFKLPRRLTYSSIDNIPQPPLGTSIKIYYNPDNPNESTFEKGVPFGLILTFICLGLAYLYQSIFLLNADNRSESSIGTGIFNLNSYFKK